MCRHDDDDRLFRAEMVAWSVEVGLMSCSCEFLSTIFSIGDLGLFFCGAHKLLDLYPIDLSAHLLSDFVRKRGMRRATLRCRRWNLLELLPERRAVRYVPYGITTVLHFTDTVLYVRTVQYCKACIWAVRNLIWRYAVPGTVLYIRRLHHKNEDFFSLRVPCLKADWWTVFAQLPEAWRVITSKHKTTLRQSVRYGTVPVPVPYRVVMEWEVRYCIRVDDTTSHARVKFIVFFSLVRCCCQLVRKDLSILQSGFWSILMFFVNRATISSPWWGKDCHRSLLVYY